jgi:hypothetical protein
MGGIMNRCTLFFWGILVAGAAYGVDGKLIASLDYALPDQWSHIAAAATPRIPSVATVVPKEPFYVYLVTRDMKADNSGQVDVLFDVTITAPNGSRYFSQQNLRATVGADVPGLALSPDFIGADFEPNDATGIYKVEATLRDLNAQAQTTVSTTVELRASWDTVSIDDSGLADLTGKYLETIPLERVPAAIAQAANGGLLQRDTAFLPMLSFFLEILNHNDFLISQLEAGFDAQTPRVQTLLVYLLQFTKHDNHAFLDALTGQNGDLYQTLKTAKLPDPYGEIVMPSQLDMLWAEVLAGGRYEPMTKLAQALDYARFQGSIDKYGSSQKTEADRMAAVKESIYRSAVWSIRSNCQQHPLVKDYCAFILAHENLSDVAKTQLKGILDQL